MYELLATVPQRARTAATLAAGGAVLMLLAACGSSGRASHPTPAPSLGTATSSSTSSGATAAASHATESNPPGDIPDNQVYVPYSPSGTPVTVKVPEGWGRTISADATTFSDKLNYIQIKVTKTATAPTAATVTNQDLPRLQATVPNYAAGKVSTVTRHAGTGVLATYQGDSPPNPVTGRVVREAFERYTFYHAGTRVDLTLSGPTNADNVDPWRIVSDSVQWQG